MSLNRTQLYLKLDRGLSDAQNALGSLGTSDPDLGLMWDAIEDMRKIGRKKMRK